jgi:glycosyltransferase involved in cell wall biosynthesis
MHNRAPDIAILMMTYNHAWSLPDCLDSLAAQTYSDFYLLIVDDGSADDSYKVAQSYNEKFKNCKILKNEKNKGALANFQHCIAILDQECPQADFFLWACPDDVWSPTFLEKTRNNLIADPKAVVCQTYIDQIYPNLDKAKTLHQLAPLDATSYAQAKVIFKPHVTPVSSAYYNGMIHGLIRYSDSKYMFPRNYRDYAAVASNEASIVAAMMLRGGMNVIPEFLFHKKYEKPFTERNPQDSLTSYYNNILLFTVSILTILPYLLKARKPQKSLSMALLLWLHLAYFYFHTRSVTLLKKQVEKFRRQP